MTTDKRLAKLEEVVADIAIAQVRVFDALLSNGFELVKKAEPAERGLRINAIGLLLAELRAKLATLDANDREAFRRELAELEVSLRPVEPARWISRTCMCGHDVETHTVHCAECQCARFLTRDQKGPVSDAGKGGDDGSGKQA